MDIIDEILNTMDPGIREKLKFSINEYKSSGSTSAKETVLNIIKEYDDKEAIIRLLCSL